MSEQVQSDPCWSQATRLEIKSFAQIQLKSRGEQEQAQISLVDHLKLIFQQIKNKTEINYLKEVNFMLILQKIKLN